MISFMILCSILFYSQINITTSSTTSSGSDNKEVSEWLKPGKCKGKWRPEKLPGRCTGLSSYKHFPELKDLPEIENATTCRALCCNIGDQCSSWQYEIYSKECRLGPVMRLGNENAGVPGWCEPNAPVKWNGKRVESRDATTGHVNWSNDVLDTQCFGLGDERKSPKDQKSRMNREECEEACANDKECEIWQEYPGRGCFYFSKAGVHCDEKKISKYEGGRKCLPGYCGGLEEKILGIKVDDEMVRQTRLKLGIKRRRAEEDGIHEGEGGEGNDGEEVEVGGGEDDRATDGGGKGKKRMRKGNGNGNGNGKRKNRGGGKNNKKGMNRKGGKKQNREVSEE